nr:MAG TPA: hypothetical protein [Bacteriophage sp.]
MIGVVSLIFDISSSKYRNRLHIQCWLRLF